MFRLVLIAIALMTTSCSDASSSCNKEETLKLIGAGYTKDEINTICGQAEQKNESQFSNSGGSPNTLSESAITSAIEGAIQSGVKVNELRFKVFPLEQDDSRGRISAAGMLITTEDRVENEGGDKIKTMALKRGMTEEQFNRHSQHAGLKKVSLYEVTLPSSSEFEFTAELIYKRNVDDFELKADVTYDIPGMALSKLAERNGQHIVYGTPELEKVFKRILFWHKHEIQTLPEKIREIYEPLADGAMIVDDSGPVGIIKAFNLADAKWEIANMLGSDGRYYKAYKTKIPIVIEPLKEFQIPYIGKFTKANTDPVTMVLSINYKNPKPNTACVYFKKTLATKDICWNGLVWNSEGKRYGGIEDVKTKKQLSIDPSYRSLGHVTDKKSSAVEGKLVDWNGEPVAKMKIIATKSQPSTSQTTNLDKGNKRFSKDKASGIITDSQTGLEWMVGPDKNTDYEQAKLWLETLSDDWGMSTRDQLKTIYKKGSGKYNIDPVFNISGSYVWAYAKPVDSAWAWIFEFDRGQSSQFRREQAGNRRVFAVRSLPSLIDDSVTSKGKNKKGNTEIQLWHYFCTDEEFGKRFQTCSKETFSYEIPWTGRSLDRDTKRTADSDDFSKVLRAGNYKELADNHCRNLGFTRASAEWPLLHFMNLWHRDCKNKR